MSNQNNWNDTNTINQTTDLIKKLREVTVTGRFKYLKIEFANHTNTYLIRDRYGEEVNFNELKKFVQSL